MRIFIGVVIGVVFCLSGAWLIDRFAVSASAAEELPVTSDSDLIGLISDIDEIYHEALAMPYQQVRTEITDPDIAAFYDKLMERTGLDKVGGS
jgi:hypothetical protein